MNILFVYPEFPNTFWSLKHALKFILKKSVYPPLGLITVAAMLPKEWPKKLIDMNIEKLRDKHLQWADLVFISAMSVQTESVKQIISRCKKLGIKTVAGGPLFTASPEKFNDIDYLILNEAESTLAPFLEDLQKGQPKHLYTSDEWPDICQTPVPLWSLVDITKYSSMNIQYSRGCPFNCEFCEITVLYGHKQRVKMISQITDELDTLYDTGWRGSVFFVDDNFIGNKERLKREVLPALIDWSEKNEYPFTFHTEASVNMADDDELMRMMVKAGFDMVFVGIETPHPDSLTECKKHQNRNRNLIDCIEKIQKHGLQVQGGFILGFDCDPETIFDTLIHFIQESGIVMAMVGLLNAPRGTKLYQKLEKENRLTSDMSGCNTDFSINFIPKMNLDQLKQGYKSVLNTIYSPQNYYKRIIGYLDKTRGIHPHKNSRVNFCGIVAFIKSVFKLGIFGKERFWFWKLIFNTLANDPPQIPTAVTFAICGYHIRKIYKI